MPGKRLAASYVMPYVIYVLIKLAFYTAWCWAGLRFWRPDSARWRTASAFGVLRLAIGITFGVIIFIGVPAHAAKPQVRAAVEQAWFERAALKMTYQHTDGRVTEVRHALIGPLPALGS